LAPRKKLTRPLTLQADAPAANFDELCAEFIRYKKLRNLAPGTIKYYEDCGRYFGDVLGEDEMCENITEDTFDDYIEYLNETKPELSTATLRSYLAGVRTG